MNEQKENRSVVDDFSVEIGAHDLSALAKYWDKLPANGRVYINAVAGAGAPARIKTAARLAQLGFQPVPHIAARRINSAAALDDYVSQFTTAGVSELLIIGGDVPEPLGPFASALDVIESGVPEKYGIERIGVAGYPDGHPGISGAILQDTLQQKIASCRDHQIEPYVVTQFSFQAESIIQWCSDFHEVFPDVYVRAGIPGPARLATLLRFAKICGVQSSARKLLKNKSVGLDLLRGTAPWSQLRALERYRSVTQRNISAHIFSFGGLREVVSWLEQVGSGAAVEEALKS